MNMPANKLTAVAEVPENERAMSQIVWIGKSKLAMTDVMPVLLRMVRTMHSLSHLSFTKLEFIADVGLNSPQEAILLYRKVRNDCQFSLRIQGVVGVRVSVRTRHSLSRQAVDSIVMMYSEKYQMDLSSNVFPIQSKPVALRQVKKPNISNGEARIYAPETPLGRYVGEPLSDEWLRYFCRHLKKAFQERPDVVLTRDLCR